MSKWWALYCALALYAVPAGATAAVPEPLRALLTEYRVPDAHIGLYVESLDDGAVVASLSAAQAFNPASVIKLLPSLAALETLSPSYEWATKVYAEKRPADGVLDGNLYIKGGGDPYLTVESTWALLKSVHALGIDRIAGDIVLDAGVFDLPSHDPGAFDDKPHRIYNGPAGGLMLNFWSLRFTISAQAGSVHIDAFPDSTRLKVVNRVNYSEAACDRRKRYVGYRVTEGTDSVTVTFNGVLSRRCPPVVITRAVIPAHHYASYVLPGLWRDAGGILGGTVRSGDVPEDAEHIYSHPSRSLGEVVRATNKFSNNMMARHLLFALGSLHKDSGITVADGKAALQEWMLSRGVDVPGLHIVNGSGLSRDTRVSAVGMANVLRAGFESRYAPEFLSAFPVAGEDWAMASRKYSGSGVSVRLKTGLIDHVRAMAAYVTTPDGSTYSAVLLVNHPGAHRGLGTRLQDALIRYLLAL